MDQNDKYTGYRSKHVDLTFQGLYSVLVQVHPLLNQSFSKGWSVYTFHRNIYLCRFRSLFCPQRTRLTTREVPIQLQNRIKVVNFSGVIWDKLCDHDVTNVVSERVSKILVTWCCTSVNMTLIYRKGYCHSFSNSTSGSWDEVR